MKYLANAQYYGCRIQIIDTCDTREAAEMRLEPLRVREAEIAEAYEAVGAARVGGKSIVEALAVAPLERTWVEEVWEEADIIAVAVGLEKWIDLSADSPLGIGDVVETTWTHEAPDGRLWSVPVRAEIVEEGRHWSNAPRGQSGWFWRVRVLGPVGPEA